MSFHNSRNASKGFKSPLKSNDALGPLVEKNLVDEFKALQSKESHLDQEIAQITHSTESKVDVKSVINLLHEFNEIKDATQIVFGKLASLDGCTIQQVHERYGLNNKD